MFLFNKEKALCLWVQQPTMSLPLVGEGLGLECSPRAMDGVGVTEAFTSPTSVWEVVLSHG